MRLRFWRGSSTPWPQVPPTRAPCESRVRWSAGIGPPRSRRRSPVEVPEGTYRSVGMGLNHACALRKSGEVEHTFPNPRGAFEELRKCADTSRAKSVISWEPGILLAEGSSRSCRGG